MGDYVRMCRIPEWERCTNSPKDFIKTIYMSAPVAGRSLSQQVVLQSSLYASSARRHEFSRSQDVRQWLWQQQWWWWSDGRLDKVLDSGSDNDAPYQAGPVSEEYCGPKKWRILSLCSPVDGNESYNSSLHTPAQKSKLAQPFTPTRSRKQYEFSPSYLESSERDQLFPDSPRGCKSWFKRVHCKWEKVGSWS